MVQPGAVIIHEKISRKLWNKLFSFDALFSRKSTLNFLRVRMHLTMLWLNEYRYKPLFTLSIYVETYILSQKFIPEATGVFHN